MEIPKMKTMRVDTLKTDSINLTLLVDQETNGIYYAKNYDHKDSLKNVYLRFKYNFIYMKKFTFFVPTNLLDKVIQLDNGSKGSPLNYDMVFCLKPELKKTV